MLRTFIKNVVKAIEAKDVDAAKTALTKAQPVIDKAVTKGLIHRNKAARHMSRMSKHIKDLATAA